MYMSYPEHGYVETGKNEEYIAISNAITRDIDQRHFDELVDILFLVKRNYLYLTDLSNIGGEIRHQSRKTPSPDGSRPSSVEHGPTGFNLNEQVIRPQLMNTITQANAFINITKTDIQTKPNQSITVNFSDSVSVELPPSPGRPGRSTSFLHYEVKVYQIFPKVFVLYIGIKNENGHTITDHGADDLLMWMLYKIAMNFFYIKGATIITNDHLKFITSGNSLDKTYYKKGLFRTPAKINKSNLTLDTSNLPRILNPLFKRNYKSPDPSELPIPKM